MDFKEIKEYGAYSGLGTILAHKNLGEDKYHITCVTTTIPSIFGTQNTIEWSSTSNSAITQIPAKKTTNSVEIPFLWNADNINIMNEIADKELQYAIINLDDGTGWKFKAKASYHLNEATADSAREGTLQLTITSVEDKASRNFLEVYMDTVTFDGAIPQRLELTAGGTQVIDFLPNPASAVLSSETNFDGYSSSVATASVGTGANASKVTITAVGAGYSYIKVKASATGYADAYRMIYVIVKSA